MDSTGFDMSHEDVPRKTDTPTSRSDAATLFAQPWFSQFASAMLRDGSHLDDTRAAEIESDFMSRLILFLLDSQKADLEFRHAAALSFFGFCQRKIGASHSQILQDLWVLYMLNERQNGYFVEFGACDGHSLSNTRLLEEVYRWTGILAEPNPVWHEALKRNRTATISPLCVAGESGRQVEFLSTDAFPELSRMAEIVPGDVHERNGNRSSFTRHTVETVTLNDLLRQHGAPSEIDYLSVDTEGSEYEILAATDFGAYRFRLITVEHAGEAEKREKIRQLLEANGYFRWMPSLSRWDDWYIHCGG